LLAAATLGAVIVFGTSDALAGAYGIAVSLLMAINDFVWPLWWRIQWGYSPVIVIAVTAIFLRHRQSIFFAAIRPTVEGRVVSSALLAAGDRLPMLTWRSGVKLVKKNEKIESGARRLRQPEEDLIEPAVKSRQLSVTAVFLASAPKGRPAGADGIRHAQPFSSHRVVLVIIADRASPSVLPRRSCVDYRGDRRAITRDPALWLHATATILRRD